MSEEREITEATPLGPLQDRELTLDFLYLAHHIIQKVPTYFFRMIDSRSGLEMGNINLRADTPPRIQLYFGHIGYQVNPEFRGNRCAARAVRLLCPLARSLKLNPLWITCDPENIASRRSCELAGATLEQIIDVPEDSIVYRTGHPRKCRYRINL